MIVGIRYIIIRVDSKLVCGITLAMIYTGVDIFGESTGELMFVSAQRSAYISINALRGNTLQTHLIAATNVHKLMFYTLSSCSQTDVLHKMHGHCVAISLQLHSTT